MEEKDRIIYSKARIAKDRNYDGRFFFAVKTTGIFCRPSCPSPAAKEENVEYYDTLFGALERGYRPCRRCRPDLNLEYHESYIPGHDKVQEALRLIYGGYLNYHSVEDLAARLSLSARQLRKLFVDTIGLPPVRVSRYHKALFAGKLLTGSGQPVTEIAFASGFGSLRQFNDTYREIFGESPSATRKNSRTVPARSAGAGNTRLLLKYAGSLDFRQILSFMEPRLIRGIEAVREGCYLRTFRTEHASGWFSVCDRPEESALELKIVSSDVRCYMELYYRVRRMFDLDTDFSAIHGQLGRDPVLAEGMTGGCVPRLPVAFSPFEFVIRAILGQQITVKAATTLAGRIAERAGQRCGEGRGPEGLDLFFPTPEELAETSLENLGITGKRQETIRTVTDAVLDGRVSLSGYQSFQHFERSFSALKGIGSWTVNYVAMRGLGMKDAFPASDLGVIKALSGQYGRLPVKEIEGLAERWRPYRSYAALCLWNRPDKESE